MLPAEKLKAELAEKEKQRKHSAEAAKRRVSQGPSPHAQLVLLFDEALRKALLI